MKALFIHRSVGQNLIIEGKIREQLQSHEISLDDYNNNTGIFTTSDDSVDAKLIAIPGNNTNPENLALFFSSWDVQLNDYELIIIKSCYPNSRIKDEAQLKSVQQSYLTIFDAFKSHQKRIVVLTSPPLRPLFTNKREVALVRKLNEWLLSNTNEYVCARFSCSTSRINWPTPRHASP